MCVCEHACVHACVCVCAHMLYVYCFGQLTVSKRMPELKKKVCCIKSPMSGLPKSKLSNKQKLH